jgi:hypothetical protein
MIFAYGKQALFDSSSYYVNNIYSSSAAAPQSPFVDLQWLLNEANGFLKLVVDNSTTDGLTYIHLVVPPNNNPPSNNNKSLHP